MNLDDGSDSEEEDKKSYNPFREPSFIKKARQRPRSKF